MIRTFLLALAIFAIVGCASAPPASPAVPLAGSSGAGSGLAVIATLATNPCEASTAPGYTAVYVATGRIERRLLARSITPDQAQPALNAAKDSLRMLDGSCINRNTVDQAKLAAATKRIGEMHKLMEAFDARK
jgi:hypothetical protein